MEAQTVHLSKLEPGLAAQLLVGSASLDPRGMTSERDIPAMAARANCFLATDTAGASQAVYLVRVENGVAWVDALKGFGPTDWMGLFLPIVEAQTQGVARVAFQTKRPGVVRRAVREHGYSVCGWILGKDMQ